MIVGIDLGTTNSLIGVMDAGFPILIADANGERLTPSVVHYPEAGEPQVGRAALRMRGIAPERTVSSVKRFMGRRFAEMAPEEKTAQLNADAKGAVEICLPGKRVSPEEISALILNKLRADAERALETEITRAVITVPAYFNDAQRGATKRAGELAGLQVERILNEPTAAALACGLDKGRERARVAVYDFGGGTFDITILERSDGVFHVASTNGNTRLGGDDMDLALLEYLLTRSGIEHADAHLRMRLLEACIAAKHRLSTADHADILLPFSNAGENLEVRISRSELEKLARPIIERTRACCVRALADANLRPGDLDEVLLVGGATRMPILRNFVTDLFEREPVTSHNPDEAVALGAVLQGGVFSGSVRDVVLLDVTPLSLGIETFGGLMNVIIPRNTTIPVKAGELFTNAVTGQSAMRISVLQGERELAKDNWQLGAFDIDFTPLPKGNARVGVQFEIDADGILHVLARDTLTGLEKTCVLKSAVDVADEKVEQMIAESVEFAFDDMSRRRFAETRLKSQEMLKAVAVALEQLQPPPETRTKVQQLAAAVETALNEENLSALLAANADLDAGTQDLAAELMDRAMDAALRAKGM